VTEKYGRESRGAWNQGSLLAKCSSNLPGTERPIPSLIEEEATFENTQVALKRANIWSLALRRFKTKNDCAGEASSYFPETERPAPPLVEEEASVVNSHVVLKRANI
jgi:hypothetical protein